MKYILLFLFLTTSAFSATVINNPFNFQPVSTVSSSSGTYTVPAGKYARVVVKSAILPVLNSVSMFSNRSILLPGGINSGGSATYFSTPSKNVHRVNASRDGAAGTLWLLFANSSAFYPVVGASNYHFSLGSNASGSYTFGSPIDLTMLATISSAASTNLTALSADVYNGPDEIWLKSGDIFTYSAGSIVYSEYNNTF